MLTVVISRQFAGVIRRLLLFIFFILVDCNLEQTFKFLLEWILDILVIPQQLVIFSLLDTWLMVKPNWQSHWH